MKKNIAIIAILLATTGVASAQQAAAPSPGDPVYLATQYLTEALNDPTKVSMAVAGLRAAKDKELLPIWAAMTKSSDNDKRLMGTVILADIGGPEAASALLDRAINENQAAIRGEAILKLIEMKAITAEQLQTIIAKTQNDENVLIICARALATMGNKQAAEPTLTKLATSNEPIVKSMARLSLLALGVDSKTQIAELRTLLVDPTTDPRILGVLLQQIADDKINDSMPMADYIARLDPESVKTENETSLKLPIFPDWLKAQAYATLSALNAPNVATAIQQEIQKSKILIYKITLLDTLSQRSDAKAAFEALAADKDQSVSLIAKFELARPEASKATGDAASAAMAVGHPIVIDYVLDKIRKEYETPGKKVDYYAPALIKVINSVAQTPTMTQSHLRAAGAATILADIGSPEAMAAIKQFFEAEYSTTQRAVCGGMLYTTNPAICPIIKPLLNSTYHEMAMDAARVLGTFGDKDAEDALFAIVVRPQQNSDALNAHAALLLLRIYKQTTPAMEMVAKKIK